jgi:hypothetical protein
MPNTKRDYYVVTSSGERHNPWKWEIRRYSSPLLVKLSGGSFRSQLAAALAGKRELDQFMKLLAEEEERSRRSK